MSASPVSPAVKDVEALLLKERKHRRRPGDVPYPVGHSMQLLNLCVASSCTAEKFSFFQRHLGSYVLLDLLSTGYHYVSVREAAEPGLGFRLVSTGASRKPATHTCEQDAAAVTGCWKLPNHGRYGPFSLPLMRIIQAHPCRTVQLSASICATFSQDYTRLTRTKTWPEGSNGYTAICACYHSCLRIRPHVPTHIVSTAFPFHQTTSTLLE